MKREVISPDHYGLDLRTKQAATYRINNPGIKPSYNVATFHLTRRYGIDDDRNAVEWFSKHDYPDRLITMASLGVGFEQEVGIHGRTIRLNTSHSEYTFFHHNEEFLKLKDDNTWPKVYIIDWVFTERPACGGNWHNMKLVAGGCDHLLRSSEGHQQLRLWDPDKGGEFPYDDRKELEITVYSSFTPDGAAGAIRTALAAYRKTLPKK